MRQSLIDVTPFMPVSDFICEYCSCVIIPEEECASAGEAAEAKAEEHKHVIKKELQRKLQLDDETLMLARDVRSLRERRKALEDEVSAAWAQHAEVMATRQKHEGHAMRLELSKRLETMTKEEVERFKSSLLQQYETAKRARAAAAAQLAKRQENLAKREAAAGEEDVELPAQPARSSLGRKLSFSRRKKSQDGPTSESTGDGPSEKPVSGLTRVLSFGRSKKKPVEGDGHENGDAPVKRESVAGQLVRKLSFGKKRST